MRKMLQKILRNLASSVLKKYKPEIIGITGSVGKTSAKEAVFSVLSSKYNVRKNEGNYNNEIGVPLTILGKASAKKNIFGWVAIFLHGLKLICFKDENYPEILILEMAADKKGDINYLTSFIPLKIAIVTAVAPVHTEFFGDIEGVFTEKKDILVNLKESGFAILNADDKNVKRMKEHTRAKVIYYGFKKTADIRCSDEKLSFSKDEEENVVVSNGFKIIIDQNEIPAHLEGVVGKQSIYAALAGVSVGHIYGINLFEIVESLKKVEFAPGRMRLIPGIKHTILIDDTYNASPRSTIAAIETMKDIPIEKNNKRIVVLGDMLELGIHTEKGHQEVGKEIVLNNIDMFVAVGEKMEEAITTAMSAGMKEEQIFKFGHPEEAGKFVQEKIKKGDIALIKGSRGMHLEKIVEELMAEPEKAEKLLVH